MNKSLIIQIGILTIILLIGYLTFSYLNKDELEKFTEVSEFKDESEINFKSKPLEKTQEINKILELSYKSSDENGNVYAINSVSGFIEGSDGSVLTLEDVTAKIIIFNYGTFFIESDTARYNKLTLDTHFSNNVNLLYLDHIIDSEDLFLKYIDKEIKISNNVKYKNNENLLEADQVNLDLVSKTSKIYMNDKTKKVIATIKN